MESNLPEQEVRDAKPLGYGPLISVVAVWAALTLTVFWSAGVFRTSPADMPAGAVWINAHSSGDPSFYIVEDGPRLILERNKHSLWLHDALVIFGWVLFCLAGIMALLGKLRNQRSWFMSNPVARSCGAVLMIVVATWWAYSETTYLMRGDRLTFDPVADVVTDNGVVVDRFHNLSLFRARTTYGRYTDYFIGMQFRDRPYFEFGGDDLGSDVIPMADDLNSRIQAMRAENVTVPTR